MARNKKQVANEEVTLPLGIGGIVILIVGLILLCASLTYTPTDLPLTPMKWLKDFSPSTVPDLPRKNIFGPLGAFLGFMQLQMFGASAFLVSIGLLFFASGRLIKRNKESLLMWVGLLGCVVCLSGFLACQGGGLSAWSRGIFLTGPGGVVGQLIGEYFLATLIAKIGASVVFVIGYLFCLALFCGIHPIEFFFGIGDVLRQAGQRFKAWINDYSRKKTIKKSGLSRSPSAVSPSLFDEEALSVASKKRKLKEVFSEKVEELPALPEEVVKKVSSPLIIDGTAKKVMSQEALAVKPFEKKERQYEGLSTDGFEGYELPGFDLLDYDTSVPEVATNNGELLEMQATIVETLKSFGVDVTAGDITRGPTITRFEVYPSVGLKVSRIASLEADIARVTKAEAINILAPIPGKDTVGIEVANADRILVPFSEILLDDKFRSSKRKIPLALGKNVYGEAVIGDLAAMPHCLVAGATGAGKSVCINTIIASILFKFSPDELRFIMVDPKVVEMQVYSKLPHLVVPVLTDPNKVVGALKWCVNEMERRYKLFAKCGVRNFDGFNDRKRPEKEEVESEPDTPEIDEPVDEAHLDSIAKALADGELGPEPERDESMGGFPEQDEEEMPDRLPYIVIIIDELADLMQTAPADVELCIARVAQKARAAGMHLIVATQTPRADVVTGIIKANIPSRISFQVSSKIDSRVILDTGGAEKLIGKGDMLFLPPGSAKLERSQGAFVSDEEVDKIVEFCSSQAEQKFEETVQQSIESGGEGMDAQEDVSAADEELMQKCLEVVIGEGKASTSLLQRRLRLGYTRAARIIDIMEQRGYVGPADGARPREVFASQDQVQ